MASDLYGYLAPRLRIVHGDVVSHLNAMRGTYDVLYSVFGAVDFTNPRELLPARPPRSGRAGCWCSRHRLQMLEADHPKPEHFHVRQVPRTRTSSAPSSSPRTTRGLLPGQGLRRPGRRGGPAHEPPRSRGIFRPASIATGSRFSAGGSGQVARSV